MNVLAALLVFALFGTTQAAEKPVRKVLLFVMDSGHEHDTLLDARLTLALWPLKEKISYWVSDAADASAKETLAAYDLAPQELPVVVLIDRDDAQGRALRKVNIRRPQGVDRNLERLAEALAREFGLSIETGPPKVKSVEAVPEPKPTPPETEREKNRRLAEKAVLLGHRCCRERNWPQAEAYYGWALRLDPSLLAAPRALADLYLAQRQYARAAAFYRRVQAVDPGVDCPLLLYDDFQSGSLSGWVTQRGAARVVDGHLELTPVGSEPGVIGIEGRVPWRNYRLAFNYQDFNAVRFGRPAPSFSCAVRSTRAGAYWFRTTTYGAEIFKTRAEGFFGDSRQLALTNLIWNDARWHQRTCEVTTLPTGAVRLHWEQDGRSIADYVDSNDPYDQGAVAFQTESGARLDEVAILRLD